MLSCWAIFPKIPEQLIAFGPWLFSDLDALRLSFRRTRR